MLPILCLIMLIQRKKKIQYLYMYYILMNYYIYMNKEKENKKEKKKKKSYDLKLYEIPIIIGEYVLEFPLEHNLEFNDTVLQIKNIENSIYIDEYTVLWENKFNNTILKNNKLHIFINGTLRRNILCSVCENINNSYVKASLKELIQEVPFKNAFCVPCTYAPVNYGIENNPIKLHVKKASIYTTNSSNKIKSINENSFKNINLIENLNSKIIVKLQVDLTEKRQVYI